MNGGKGLLARIAIGVSSHFSVLRVRKIFGKELQKTRSDSLDRVFLATKRGRLDEPPYASLRQ